MGEQPSGQLRNRIALVTGAASGIGRQTALLFAQEGAHVAVADLNQAGVEETARTIEAGGGTALALVLDVTSEPAWAETLHAMETAWGALDVLVHCAGITDDAPVTTLTLAQWRRVMATNLDGTFLGTAAALRSMQRTGRGAIITVSSASGIKASPGASAYCASKAGVIQFTRTVALECAQAGTTIRVNCVVPGAVKTPMWETTLMWPDIAATDAWTAAQDTTPLHRFAHPLEIAQTILFLASDASSFVTGAVLVVDGGYTL